VTALQGQVQVAEPGSDARTLSFADSVREQSVLQLGAGAWVDLALGEVAGVHLSPGTELALDETRPDRVALRLVRGSISNDVARRGSDQNYEILAASHRIVVRGTRFAVRAGGTGGVAVRCDEGVVEVFAPDGDSTLLRAPATWSERVIARPDAAVEPALEVATPYVLSEGAPLSLPVFEGLEGWELKGQAVPADGELTMRVPPGSLELVALLAGGRREVVKLDVDPLGVRVAPEDLSFLASEQDDQPPPAATGPAREIDASGVIRAGRPALQRCYERSLKNESSGSHALRLSIAIDPKGRVRKVEPSGQQAGVELPSDLVRCIRTTVSAWRYPAPGGDGISLEAPLRFQLRR